MPSSNHLLHRVIRETGWTYEALARRLNARARASGVTTGYDRTSVAHWLRGSTPRDPVPGLLCEILAARLNRPVGPDDIGMDPGAAPGVRGDGPADPGRGARAADLLAAVPGLHPHRRPRATDGAPAPHRVPEQRERGGGQVPALSHTVLRRAAESFFTGQVDALGGDATAPVLLAYLRSTFRTALTSRGDGSLSDLEIGHAARTLLLLARSYADQCSFAESRRTLSRAASLAELAGEPSTQAIALRMLGQDALDQNQPAVALSYVSRALAASPRAPGAVRAFVAAQAAHVHAALGHRAEALVWLDTADRLQGDATGDADPFHAYGPAALHFKRAIVLGLLGDHRAAHAALDASLAARPAQQERAIMLTHVERARLYRLSGDEEEAEAELRRAEALNRGVHSPRATREIGLLGPGARPR
ncbi:hypothetical protein SAVIM338S_00603 [Streptomyces avidinii]